MSSVIRSEVRKLTTVRAPWLLLAAGPLLVVAGIAAIGVGLGALIRNPAAAVAVALAWFAVIEGITGQLLGSALARWLPFCASEALSRSNLQATARLLPQWGGGLILLGYAAVFATVAVLTTLRRGVT